MAERDNEEKIITVLEANLSSLVKEIFNPNKDFSKYTDQTIKQTSNPEKEYYQLAEKNNVNELQEEYVWQNDIEQQEYVRASFFRVNRSSLPYL